jgi:hypothetical protein
VEVRRPAAKARMRVPNFIVVRSFVFNGGESLIWSRDGWFE